jgi:hypothetical protein
MLNARLNRIDIKDAAAFVEGMRQCMKATTDVNRASPAPHPLVRAHGQHCPTSRRARGHTSPLRGWPGRSAAGDTASISVAERGVALALRVSGALVPSPEMIPPGRGQENWAVTHQPGPQVPEAEEIMAVTKPFFFLSIERC